MQVNLPPKVRQVIYAVATVLSPTMYYLNQQGTVTDFQFGLYSVIMAGVTALAFVNVNTSASYKLNSEDQ
jgi:hypothetical protein